MILVFKRSDILFLGYSREERKVLRRDIRCNA